MECLRLRFYEWSLPLARLTSDQKVVGSTPTVVDLCFNFIFPGSFHPKQQDNIPIFVFSMMMIVVVSHNFYYFYTHIKPSWSREVIYFLNLKVPGNLSAARRRLPQPPPTGCEPAS